MQLFNAIQPPVELLQNKGKAKKRHPLKVATAGKINKAYRAYGREWIHIVSRVDNTRDKVKCTAFCVSKQRINHTPCATRTELNTKRVCFVHF